MPRYDDNGNLIPEDKLQPSRYFPQNDYNVFAPVAPQPGNLTANWGKPQAMRYDDNGKLLPQEPIVEPPNSGIDPVLANATMWDAPQSTVGPVKYSGRAKPLDEYNRQASNVVANMQPSPFEMTGMQQGISTGLRVVPAVAGSVLGAMGGFGFGAIAGGAGGSFLGELAGQGYDKWINPDYQYNPTQLAVQTGLGAINIAGPAAKLGGAGLKEVAKYAGKTALLGAAEGGVTNALGAIPTEWAESGKLATPDQIAAAALSGTAFGAATGGTIGGYQGRKMAKLGQFGTSLTGATVEPPKQGPNTLTLDATQPAPTNTAFYEPPVAPPVGPPASTGQQWGSSTTQPILQQSPPIVPTNPPVVAPPKPAGPPPGMSLGVNTPEGEIISRTPTQQADVDRINDLPPAVQPPVVQPPVAQAPPVAPPIVEQPVKQKPPSQRAKIFRGNHDAVDVMFPDDESRYIFGAGKRLSPSGNNKQTLEKFGFAAKRISEKTGLTDVEARKAINDYSAYVKGLTKEQPKFGEGLSVDAKSFNDWLTETRLPVEAPKPRVRQTSQGEFVNPKTGEVLDVKAPDDRLAGAMRKVETPEEAYNKGKAAKEKYEAELAQHEASLANDPDLIRPFDEPSEARVEGPVNPKTGRSNIVMGGADKDVLDALGVALYKSDPASTSTTELFQNAADERNISGIDGPIKVGFNHVTTNPETNLPSNSLVIKDEGRGIKEEDLYTIFTDIGKSGKRDIAKARGGFGFAKAAPLLGGDYVKITSIVDEGGQKVKYTFEGNPEQLKTKETGVELNREVLDPGEKTGFQVEVFFPKYKLNNAARKIDKIVENSPGMSNVHKYQAYGQDQADINAFLSGKSKPGFGKIEELAGPKAFPPKVNSISTPGAEIDIHYELDDKTRKGGEIIYLNNGAYAVDEAIGYNQFDIPHVPGKIVLNVKPTVKDTARTYPFELNREGIKDELKATVKKWISDNVVKDAEQVRVGELQKVFDDLAPVKGNKHVVLDSGKRYTAEELRRVEQSPHLRKVADVMGGMYDRLDKLFPSTQLGKTIKYGFRIADSTKGGVNIPSPKATASGSGEYALLVNPLGAMENFSDPKEAAEFIAHVALHEFNHNIARDEGANFTWNLAITDSKYSTARRAKDAEAILKAITGSDGNYAPEIQGLLREYTAARGRPDTELDTLSRSAEIAEPERFRSSGISSGAGSNRGGTFGKLYKEAKETLGRIAGNETGAVGLGGVPGGRGPKLPVNPPPGGKPPKPPYEFAPLPVEKEPRKVKDYTTKFFRAVHGMKTTGDMGPVLRQGKNFFGRSFWNKALIQQFKSYASEASYKKSREALAKHELMVPQKKFGGKSWAEIANLYVGSHKQEEALAGVDFAEGLFEKIIPKRKGKAIINPARASARAYEVIDDIRIGAAKQLYDAHVKLYESKIKTDGRKAAEAFNPDNPEVAKKIGDEINQATGRSKLKVKERFTPNSKYIPERFRNKAITPDYLDMEDKADAVNLGLFAGRYMKSNMDQIGKMVNTLLTKLPAAYKGDTTAGLIAREHLKQLLSYTSGTIMLAQLHAVMGAKVETDPLSSDFGKGRYGKRVTSDYAGGMGKYFTLGKRAYEGKIKNRKGKEIDLVDASTREVMDLFTEFGKNQVSAPAAMIMAIANRKERFGGKDRGLHLTSLDPTKNALTKTLAMPITWQNFVEIMREDPSYAPLITLDTLGGGTNVEER